MTPMSDGERDRLIDDLLDGDIAESDFLRLEAEMIIDEEARHAYYDRQKLQTGLTLDAEEFHSSSSPGAAAIGGRPRFGLDRLTVAGVATLALLVGLLGWKVGQDTERARVVRDGEPVISGFGVIAGPAVGEWEDLSLREGDLLPEGELVLESGITAIELFSGVELLVEGPAMFEIASGMDVILHRGHLQARVPSVAKGFRVATRSGAVSTDRAEFIVDVAQETEAVRVVEGTAKWNFGEAENILTAGEGMRRSADGTVAPVDGATKSMTQTKAKLASDRDSRRDAWEVRSQQLQDDPRLLLHFSMAHAEFGGLPDQSGAANHGTIVRADRSTDRWGRPGGALDFSPTGSRVRVDIPGEHESLTLMCWVKIDGLDRWYNSLFLTDGHELNEPHWQIMDDGRLFFSVRARENGGRKDKHIAYSPPIWTPAQSGQWMHLATTYDGAKQTITHYVNGEAVSIDPIPEGLQPEKVVIGPASVGNWSEPKYRTDADFVMRNLNGAIDEFLVFGAALGAGEVAEIFEAGMP